MKKKTMAILSIVLVVALTAVGFAAWLIVGNIGGDTTGSFVSNELEDKYFTIKVKFDKSIDEDNGNIVFGAPEGTSATGRWLTYSNEDAKEKLSAIATIEFKPDQGFVEGSKEMDYYLLDSETKNTEGVVTARNYRKVRVVIDIFEEASSTNYEWFDMAVQLGYIQYPTAHLREAGTEPGSFKSYKEATTKFDWRKPVTVGSVTSYNELGTGEAGKFADCVLFVELTYDMFEIQYTGTNGQGKKTGSVATAQIEINFNWGAAVSTTTTDGEDTIVTYENPYNYFGNKNAEGKVVVEKYLTSANVLQPTVENDDAATTDVIEGLTNLDAKTIRYKDLAARMLDYLRNHVNYDSETETGLQFSITLLEGTTQTIAVS